jgi:hypothetical protein
VSSVVLGGLRRVIAAPGLWLGCWAAVAAMAWVVGACVQFVAAAAVGPFDALDLGRAVFGVLDVLRVHPEVGIAVAMAVAVGSLASTVGWTVVSPLVIARLAEPRGARELGGRALAGLPAVIVQSGWHLLMRAALMVAVLLSVRPLPDVVVWVVCGLVWLGAGVALDATRVAVVEHEAAPWHVKTAWQGFVRVVKRPRVLVPGVVLGAGQLAIGGVIVWMALAELGSGSAWAARGLALFGVGLGLWRVAIVVVDATLESEAE